MLRFSAATVVLLSLATPTLVAAADPTAEQLLKRYDQVMSPRTFDGLLVMIAHRQDDTTRTYKFRALKSQDDKIRTWFFEPAAAKGQEMLRVEDNMWVYMPNLKRALRLASRESFQGGDFNNGDVLRVNYVADYNAKLIPAEDDKLWLLDLTAKSKEAAYDHIKLWMSKDKQQPAKAEYYAASGKMLRSAKFEDVKSFHGLERPAHMTMRNELATKRYTEMMWLDLKLDLDVPAQKFVVDDLGR
ncbi:MAG TPA: outer membrane lipoprotein-sorting protein [Pseudomonadota bacterium]|nr:outer membrane lipoprotein-sorting protein [Pseudomonadota bacterium]